LRAAKTAYGIAPSGKTPLPVGLTFLPSASTHQRGQSLLNVNHCFRLKAGADFFQSIDKPLVSSDGISPFNPSR